MEKRILINLVDGSSLEFETIRSEIFQTSAGISIIDKLDRNSIIIPITSILFYETQEVEECT